MLKSCFITVFKVLFIQFLSSWSNKNVFKMSLCDTNFISIYSRKIELEEEEIFKYSGLIFGHDDS